MAYRNKTYICFDGDNNMHAYRLMQAWRDNENHDFNFHDAHDLNSARDTSTEESIKRQLRVRFEKSKTLIVLIGDNTKYLLKFVKWEMEVAIKLDLPIIGVNLNGSRKSDALCPPAIANTLAVFVPFRQKIIAHALDNWPPLHRYHSGLNDTRHYIYEDSLYTSMGIG